MNQKYESKEFIKSIDQKIELNYIKEFSNHDVIFYHKNDLKYFLYNLKKSGFDVKNGRVQFNNELIFVYGKTLYSENNQIIGFLRMVSDNRLVKIHCLKHGNFITNLYSFCLENHFLIFCDNCPYKEIQILKITEIIKKGSVK